MSSISPSAAVSGPNPEQVYGINVAASGEFNRDLIDMAEPITQADQNIYNKPAATELVLEHNPKPLPHIRGVVVDGITLGRIGRFVQIGDGKDADAEMPDLAEVESDSSEEEGMW